MKIPDYVSPIIAYRVWQWDGSLLKSLSGESWYPRQPLTARCCLSHQPPHQNCRCGIYAHKLDSGPRMCSLPRMSSLPRMRSAPKTSYSACIGGEVYLWGTVVEHEFGWRAQFAYPKSIFVPCEMIPVRVKRAQSWLQAFIAYGSDIFIEDGGLHIAVWTRRTGYDSAGLDYVRKVATGEVGSFTVPIAILTEDPKRHILLQNGVEVKHASNIVFTETRLTPKAVDPIVSETENWIFRIKNRPVKVVVVDLTPENARFATEAIWVIRAARRQIAVFVRLNQQDPLSVNSGMFTMADAYLHKDGKNDVQYAFEEFLKRRPSGRTDRRGPRAGPPPPPAVPVHSLVDIIRIIQSRRDAWPTQWALAGEHAPIPLPTLLFPRTAS